MVSAATLRLGGLGVTVHPQVVTYEGGKLVVGSDREGREVSINTRQSSTSRAHDWLAAYYH